MKTLKKIKTLRRKELIRILMESSLYFDLSLKERQALIHRLLTANRSLH